MKLKMSVAAVLVCLAAAAGYGITKNSEPKDDAKQILNGGKMSISIDHKGLTKSYDKIYAFEKLDKIGGWVYPESTLASVDYSVKYGNMDIASGKGTVNGSKWEISPIKLMPELNNREKGNTVYIEVTDITGKKANCEYNILYHDIDYDFLDTLDTGDDDGDELYNYEEEIYDTDKNNADTDGDGMNDGYEVNWANTDPAVKNSNDDSDRDGLDLVREQQYRTDPNNSDTDHDGLYDGKEAELGTDPTNRDTDGDHIDDNKELIIGLDPFDPDQNKNGIADNDEEWTASFTIDESDRFNYDSRVVPTFTVKDKPDILWTASLRKYDFYLKEGETPGFMGDCFWPEIAGQFKQGVISAKFDSKFLEKKDLDPVLYQFDTGSMKLKELPNQKQDMKNCTVSADIYYLGQCILLDRTELEKQWGDRIIKNDK